MEEIKTLAAATVVLFVAYVFLLKAHRFRRISRPLIYRRLYGPVLFLLVMIPVVFQFAAELNNPTWTTLLLLLLSLPLYLQLAFSLAMVVRLFFNRQNFESPDLHDLREHPKVAIILPTYKEPFDVARMTLDSLIAMEYDGEWKIIVVDNSADDHDDLQVWKAYVKDLRELFLGSNLSVEWISRDPAKKGYKPLNLDVAYDRYIAKDWEVAYVMYVDTDSTFHPHTLNDLIKAFSEDEEVAYIQLMTVANNMGVNGLSRAVGMQQTIFRYVLGEIGNWGMPIFYGHNAMFRRAVIPQLGSFLEMDANGEFMLTEDFSMTIRTYLQGGYGKPHWVLSGEGVPTSLAALKGMWERWAVGGLQVLFKYFSKVIVSKKISFYEKASFVFHGMCYPSQALIPLLILASPFIPEFTFFALAVVVLNAGLSAIGFEWKFAPQIEATRKHQPDLISYFLSFFAVNSYIIWVMFLSTWKFLYRLLIPKKYRERLTWVVTPKGQEEKMSEWDVIKDNAYILVFIGLFTGISAHFLINFYFKPSDLIILLPGGLFCFNLLLTLVVFGRARKASNEPPVHPPGYKHEKELETVRL